MSKRSFLRKSAVSLAATLGLGGSIAFAQVSIPPNQTGNSSDTGSSSLGNQTITFTAPGGTLTLNGTGAVVNNRLRERWYDTEFGTGFLNPISNLINATAEIDQELNGPLNYRGDAGMTPVTRPGTGGLTDLEQYSGLWTGFMNITTPGEYGFAVGSDDGSVLWIDLNRDGTFGAGELIADRNRDTGYGRDATDFTTLAAANYPIAIGFYENGGGNDMEALIQRPGGTLDFIDPSAASQAGIWSYIGNVSTNANFSTNPIVLNASGTINVTPTASLAATVGAVSMARGTTLTTEGARLITPSTTLTGTGTTATFAGSGTFDAGTFNAGATPIDIVQTGPGGVRFSKVASTVPAGSTVTANGGTVAVAMGATTTSVGSAPITLNSGTLALITDPTSINGPGLFGTTGQFYPDPDIFNPILPGAPDNGGVGWTGLDSKTQLDAKLNPLTPAATRSVDLPINFPRGDANPANGGTNDFGPEQIFNVDGANLGVPLTGNDDFVARFTGKLNVTAAGPTEFLLMSNDGAALFIDLDQGAGTNWQKVVDNNRFSNTGGGAFQGHYSGSSVGVADPALAPSAGAPAINNPAPPNLSAGQYDYIVGTFNKNADEFGIELFWDPAGGADAFAIVPFAGELPTFNFTNTVTVNGNSGISVERPTTMPNIRLNNGSSLVVNGQPLTLTQTTIDGTARVDMNTTVNLGNIVPATAGAPWTLIKGGSQPFNASGPNFSGLSSAHGVGVAGGRLLVGGGQGAAGVSSIGSAKIMLSGGTFVANSGILETPGAANTLTEYWYHTSGNIPETSIEPPDAPGGLLRITPTGTMPLTESLDQFGDDQGTGDTVDIGARWGRVDQVAAGWFGEWTFTGGAAHGNNYTFASQSDDGSAIWIDLDKDGTFEGGGRRRNDGTTPNEMVLDNNDYQGDEAFSSLRTIPDGTYRVFLGWYEGGGGATSSYKWQRGDGSWAGNNNGLYDSSPTLLPIDPTVSTVAASRGRSFDLNADTGNASFQGNAVEVIGGTTTLEAGGPGRFGAMTFTNTATVNAAGNKTTIASVTTATGTGTLNSGIGPNNLSIGDLGASAGATTVLGGDNRRVTGALTGAGGVRIASGVVEFTRSGASTSTGTLDLRPNLTPAVQAAEARFNPGAGGTFAAAGITAITNEGFLHAASGITDLSGAVATTTVVGMSGTVPGLVEGRLEGGFNETAPNTGSGGVVLSPLKAYDSGKPPWGDNETWVYTGQMFFPDNGAADGQSQFSLAEHIDDNVLLKIDGVQVLRNTQWDVATSTGPLTLPAGWHDVDFRFAHGGGGAGPSGGAGNGGANGWTADFGFGVDFTPPIEGDINRANYAKVEDPGNATLLRFMLPNTGVVQVDNGATLRLGAVRGANAVNIDANGRLELHGGASKINAGALSIAGTPTAPTSTLDVTDSAIVLDFPAGGPNPAADVRSRIVVGRAGTELLGNWTGRGITSSAAAADPSSLAVGFATNSDLPLGAYTQFGGLPVDPSSVIIRGTRIGDANLDGVVNDDDVTIVGATFGMTSGAVWALGDFTYDGAVNDDDVTLLGALYDPSAAPVGFAAPVAAAGAVAAVPEPATWLMLTLGGLGAGLFGWRRRKV
ncbi:MAG: PEP-CTERM sorting domain-containing protein [Pirellulales bacterium]